MRQLALAIGVVVLVGASAAGAQSRIERSLQRLAPGERLEQLCNYTAMKRIRKEYRQYRPDRAVADARSAASIKSNTVDAKGAVFRSRRKWYALSYTCTASPETLKVQSFAYEIGAEIPQSKWAAYSLWE